MLAHKYEVEGVKELLLRHGITAESVCAAASFACESVADVGDGLLEACRKHASWSLPKVRERALAGVTVGAAGELVRAHAENPHLGRVCDVAEGFRFVERWVRANQDALANSEAENKAVQEQAESLVDMLELSRLPGGFLWDSVQRSGLVSNSKVWKTFQDVVKAERQARSESGPVRLRQVAKISDCLDDGDSFKELLDCVVGGSGPNQRLAVVDKDGCRVYVFSLEDMKCLFVAGRKGEGPGEFQCPFGAAFDGQGNLYVSDEEMHRVQVFDLEGNFVRCFGKKGEGVGELLGPSSLAVSSQGDFWCAIGAIIVCRCSGQTAHFFGSFLRRMTPTRPSYSDHAMSSQHQMATS